MELIINYKDDIRINNRENYIDIGTQKKQSYYIYLFVQLANSI
jgi:hypothetical protein